MKGKNKKSKFMLNLNEIDNIDDLKEIIVSKHRFDKCAAIKKEAINTVFSRGNRKNPLVMFIGEAPGADEDKFGIPFCGRSGKLLDAMLCDAGFNKDDYYVSNTVFWRPPNNRRPTQQETEECRPFVEKHISLVMPNFLILLGKTAAESVLGIDSSLSMHLLLDKKFHYCNDYFNDASSKKINARILFHPAYILRNMNKKSEMVARLKLLRNILVL